MNTKWKRKIGQSVLISVLLFVLIFFAKMLFYKDTIILTLIDEYGVTSLVRWNNLTDGYPFLGEDVCESIQINPQNQVQKVYIEVQGGRSDKIRIDFSSPNLVTATVTLQEICIQTPFKTMTLEEEDIIECFYGVNGVEMSLENDGVLIQFHDNNNQFIESMNTSVKATYSRVIFEWLLRGLYTFLFVLFFIFNDGWGRYVLKYQQQLKIIIIYSFTLFTAIIINFVLEWIVRKDFHQSILFMLEHTWIFILDVAIIWSVLLIGTFLKHWIYGVFLGIILFVVYMIGAYFVASMRGNMIVWQDLTALPYGFAIISNLFEIKTIHIVVVVFIFSLVLSAIYYLFRRVKWKKPKMRCISVILLAFNFIVIVFVSKCDIWNLNEWSPDAQFDNGCLGTLYLSFLNQRIEEPEQYSKDIMQEIIQMLEEEKEIQVSGEKKENPNLIFLQIEAFVDPMKIEGLTFSEDPIPNFRRLTEEFGSGTMKVPVFGGATVNTEFEILTGLPVTWLRNGEYPYLTHVVYDTVESIAYYLDKEYKTTVNAK